MKPILKHLLPFLFLLPGVASAADLDGTTLSLGWTLPF